LSRFSSKEENTRRGKNEDGRGVKIGKEIHHQKNASAEPQVSLEENMGFIVLDLSLSIRFTRTLLKNYQILNN
jgi:hypothetical protein